MRIGTGTGTGCVDESRTGGRRTGDRRWLALVVTVAAMLVGCNGSATSLRLRNLTPHTLTPYPVVTDPAPPHRAADANSVVPQGGFAPIDPTGFNAVFYAGGVSESNVANGIYIGLGSIGSTPPQLQYRVYHYLVPPGQTGENPALQPMLLHEGVVDVPDVDVTITVRQPTDAGAIPPPGGWDVTVTPN